MKQIRVFRKAACALFVLTLSLSSCVQDDIYDDLYDEDMSSWMMIGRRKFKNDNGDQSNNNSSSESEEPNAYDELHPEGYVDPWPNNEGESGQMDNQTHNNPIVPHLPDPQVEVPDVIPMPESDLGYWRKWIDKMPKAEDIMSNMKTEMINAWNETAIFCNEYEWGEIGFWIYYNPVTQMYSRSAFIPGTKAPYGQQVYAAMNLTNLNPPVEDTSINGRGFVVGWCHTHPRVEKYQGTNEIIRENVGPSKGDGYHKGDIELSNEWGLPGFVVDYADNCSSKWGPYTMMITSFGPKKRDK